MSWPHTPDAFPWRAFRLGSLVTRTAGLFWTLVVATLGLYLAFTIPEQRRVILDNMQSEAQNIATSISQVTATAIITEDYSAAIDHCLKVVQESPTLRYVVITRNDGFSLIHTHQGWSQQQLGTPWSAPGGGRVPASGFQRNELADDEVFHYRHPFEYSGIEWGWIHIGLSLDQYREGTRSLYRRTVLLAVLCSLGSLLVAFYFARRITRPIDELGQVTQRVAAGDLSAKARVSGGQELERLADSFNQMTGALQISQDELMAAREYTEEIIRSLNDALVVTDVEGRIQAVNRAAERLLGYSGMELLGQPLSSILVREGPDRGRVDLAATNQTRHTELFYRAKDGRMVPVLFSAAPIQGQEGTARGFACVAVDITHRKRVEQELHDAKEAAEAANLAKSQFLANMSHEIRTPMNGVLGMTELLLGTDLTERQQRYTQTAHDSAEKLLRVLNDILDFSRIEAGHMTLLPTTFALKDLVREVVDLLAISARAKQLDLITSLDPTLPRSLRGDPVRLRQILVNLVGNAVKFTNDGGVSVRVSSDPEQRGIHRVRFDVVDTGTGITEADCARLFRPFSQVDASAARKHGGTGLGLAISRHLAELMGGEIGLVSTPGKGSTFWFSVPLERAAPAATPPAPSPEPEVPTAPVSGRILLAEDNRVNRELAQEMLEALGAEVISVKDGAQAVAAWADGGFDLVLMDCQMPELDGYEATREIRRREVWEKRAQVPIVALTAHAMQGDREQCLAAGMDDHVAKPFRQANLDALLRRYLAPRDAPAAVAAAAPRDRGMDSTEQRTSGPDASSGDPIDDEAFADLRAMERGGRHGVVRRVLSLYLEESPTCLKALQEAAAAGDTDALWKAAHSFKTMSANAGASALAARCSLLEQAGRAGASDGSVQEVEILTAEYAQVRAALEARLAAEDFAPARPDPDL